MNDHPKPIQGTAKLLERIKLTDKIYEFKFEMTVPEEMNFRAGQYIAIIIDPKTRRQYSISNAPSKSSTIFEMIIDITPNGIGTKYLMGLNEGDKIEFIGQIGLFVLPEKLKRNLYFISTGTGMAPLKSMVEELILQNKTEDHQIYFIFGTRYESDAFYYEEMTNYFVDNEITHVDFFLSRESALGFSEGYVTKYFDEYKFDPDNSQFFICGSQNVIESVHEKLVGLGAKEEDVYFEKFY